MTETSAETGAPGPNRRAKAIASLLLIAAAGVLWGASRMTWAEVYVEDGLSEPRIFAVTGSDWSPWLVAIALFFLAALVVQFVLHGIALRIVAVVVALAGIAVAIPAVTLINSGADSMYAAEVIDLPARYDVVAITSRTGAGILVLVAAACAVLGAIAMLRSASSASKMSSKYTSPAARREELERRVFAEREARQAGQDSGAASERELWEALDHGVDPTDDLPETGGGQSDPGPTRG
ncbi:TIGR02234 family membrane protein [Gordonia caeni]|uniref:TIGR02234 family membrane protein n=1 Tax=Gordonia caeni TaxID=1007097 RepID=A0ABP7PET3_9ACTN